MTEEIKEELNEACECEENCECKGKEKKSREAKKYEKKINELNEELAKWQEQFAKALNTAAHHENLSKYYKNEYERFAKYRSQAMIEKLLPVLDSFQMAFSMQPTTDEAKNYKIGFEFILRMFKDALEQEGVKEIVPVVGQEFDASFQQAVETVEVEDIKDANKIQKVILNGYMLKDRLIRPANVIVSVLKKEEVIKEDSNVESDEIKN